jgi:response regulator RpfG family c-di-GMP phosphodiesterase
VEGPPLLTRWHGAQSVYRTDLSGSRLAARDLESHANITSGDDEIAARALAARFLRMARYEVLEAGDGLQAWTLFRRHPSGIDALLSDVVMPRMTGTELAARVHGHRPPVAVYISPCR